MSKVLITGGTGFIGRAVVSLLNNRNLETLLLAHRSFSQGQDYPESPYIQSTSPINWLNTEVLAEALVGCDAVIHLARATQGNGEAIYRQTLAGTQSLLQAAIQAQVKRFIHISSISVYGEPPLSRVYTESSPRLASLQTYAAMKQATEKLVLQASSALEVVTLQPSIVYGPGSGYWTQGILRQMQSAVIPLIAGGDGFCNPIYVNDVAQAILQALTVSVPTGHCFLITNDEPVTWREFMGFYEKILGKPALLSLPTAYLQQPHRLPSFLNRAFKKTIRSIYQRSLYFPSAEQLRFFAAQPIFRNQKAKQFLDFQPTIALAEGMARVKEWWQAC